MLKLDKITLSNTKFVRSRDLRHLFTKARI